MTNQQILEKAIQKAIDGGFHSFADGAFGKPEFIVSPEDKFGHIKIWVKDWPDEWVSAEYIIFSHDFAKALWGEKLEYTHILAEERNVAQFLVPNWKKHLMQMVIADDPIKYLGENI